MRMFCEDVMVATMAATLWPWGRTNGIAYASVWSPDIAKSLNKCFLLNVTCIYLCRSLLAEWFCVLSLESWCSAPRDTEGIVYVCDSPVQSNGRWKRFDFRSKGSPLGSRGCQQGMDLDRKIKLRGENARLINSLKPTVVNTVSHKNTQKANEQGSRGQQWQHELVSCAKARQTSHGRGQVQI